MDGFDSSLGALKSLAHPIMGRLKGKFRASILNLQTQVRSRSTVFCLLQYESRAVARSISDVSTFLRIPNDCSLRDLSCHYWQNCTRSESIKPCKVWIIHIRKISWEQHEVYLGMMRIGSSSPYCSLSGDHTARDGTGTSPVSPKNM